MKTTNKLLINKKNIKTTEKKNLLGIRDKKSFLIKIEPKLAELYLIFVILQKIAKVNMCMSDQFTEKCVY